MALNKKRVIIIIGALAVIGGIGIATGTTNQEASGPVTSSPAPAPATTDAPAPTATDAPAPTTTNAPAPPTESTDAAETAPAQVVDDAEPADIETILSGFPGDGEGYVVLDSAAADHAQGTVVGLEVATPEGTTERGVWILRNDGGLEAANTETKEQTSAAWPVRKDARYAQDDEVISVATSLGMN